MNNTKEVLIGEPVKDENPVGFEPLTVDTDTAAKMLGISRKTLANWRARYPYVGPEYVKCNRKVLYTVSGLKKFIADNLVKAGASWQ